ncbi:MULTISPECIES: LrgB family protein [Heyndrickxia]|uniref:LrgB-like protein n=1 Tax=Heyndrickxia oleronia TaxID=38875 RepID=A0A8E2LBZ2_9BACI|nr:LrgB family protein [Heyndrickxia oleronia]NYV64795.1 LrgB family protein [Bacillus sp. Gen3]OJH19293.1 hypothetical protein BLX88_08890 [Bacillus obstructivus]MBU5210528.1 LrgB family protein [Heyndrickxia oleronia]MCI1593287.1 LrgB family protein [Heyndrickxia oleronia]MCI1613526.1 LrgB family protein [Heyndrickxia oleronia]
MQHALYTIIIILFTVLVYFVMNKLYRRFSYPIFIPVLTSTIIIIVILELAHIPYTKYMTGGKWINSLLGPAIVALAFPLYNQRHILKKYWFPIITGVIVGLLSGMFTGPLLGELIGIDQTLILSIIPKSLTTPVAVQVASGIGGSSAMAVVSVMIAGFTGVLLGPVIFKWTKIHSSIGKGIGLGCTSHALGTAKSNEYGEVSFSMSSVSMTLCAVLGSIIGPIVALVFS